MGSKKPTLVLRPERRLFALWTAISFVPSERERPLHSEEPYVDESRISQLSQLTNPKFDFSRLETLCRELNVAHENEMYHAVGMLLRAIMDHIPPVFSQTNFAGVTAQYGGQSFKKQMKALDEHLRNVADGHLHTQIRSRESLPNFNQVGFRSSLDALLAEIIRIS